MLKESINGIGGRHRSTIIAAFMYGGLTLLMTWPLAAQFGSHIPGLVGDSFIHLWTFEFIKDALLSGQSPYFTDQLFYPEGTTLIFHNIAWINILIWLFYELFVDNITAFTLMFMSVLAFNGLATFLLARELLKSAKIAFIAGLICAFWPYIMSHQDHPNLIFVGWIALALLYLRRLFAHGRYKDALLAALFIILTGVSRWQLLIMAAPLLGFYILYELLRPRSSLTRHHFKLIAAVGLISLLGLTPLMAPLVYNQVTRNNPEDLFVDEPQNNTDLLAFVVPSRYHPLWGQQGFDWSWPLAGNVNYVPFLGFTTLLLALIGAVGAWRKTGFWTFITLFYLLMALGSELHINGPGTFPLPYALIEETFVVQTIRHPERLNVILSIPFAILAGFGVSVLVARPRLQRHTTAVIAAFSLFIIGEYIVTFPSLEIQTPAFYDRIATAEGEFAVLDIPMHMRRKFDKQYMIYQLTHERPLIEGHVSRPPREAFDFINSVPLLAGSLETKQPPAEVGNVSRQFQLLADASVRYLILHKQFLNEEELASWQDWLIISPSYEDEDLVVYQTKTALVGEDVLLAQPMLPAADGSGQLGLINSEIAANQVRQGGWVEINTQWGTSGALDQELEACFTLNSPGNEPITTSCQPVSSDYPTATWEANELIRSKYFFQSDPHGVSGDYLLALSLQDQAGNPIGNPAVIGDIEIERLDRKFEAPSPTNPSQALWDEIILLAGYDLSTADSQLNINFYWHPNKQLETSYKFFLHIIDTETGQLVTQMDFVPQNWGYPTDWWAADEYILDPVSIRLDNLPPGAYKANIGIYQPDSGQRLPITWAEDLVVEGNALTIYEFER